MNSNLSVPFVIEMADSYKLQMDSLLETRINEITKYTC